MKNLFEYQLTQEYVELNHLLKFAGLAESGGAGGALVTTGVVKVDGQVELRKRNKIRPGQIVTTRGLEIHVLAAPEGSVQKTVKAPKPAAKTEKKPARKSAKKPAQKAAKKPVAPW